MNKPTMPRLMRSALADLVRFGSLQLYPLACMSGDLYAAARDHLPEGGHDPKAIAAIVDRGFGVRHSDGSVCITDAGRRAWDGLNREAA